MRTRFDQFAKQMIRGLYEVMCAIETDAEVSAEPRHVDLWFTPDATGAVLPDHAGLLRPIPGGPGTMEFFHDTPSGDELTACIIKHGLFRQSLALRKMLPPTLTLWVISSGRPEGCIDDLGFRPLTGWPPGVYEAPRPWWTRLIVVNELPAVRDTLLVRLLGAGAVLRQAIAELQALPADAPERLLALPILLRLRLAVPTDPAMQTSDDQEFLMTTQDIVETWRQTAIQEGVEQGLEQGREQGLKRERRLVLRLLRRRFGNQVDVETERRVESASAEQVEVWAERVLFAATLAEVLAD